MEIFFFYIDFLNENLQNNYFIYFLLYLSSLIIFFSFSLPGGAIVSVASGFFFGFYIGFIINIISILVGSYIFVYFTKNIFKKLFNKYDQKITNKLTKVTEKSSYEYLIILRLIQGIPLFFQNLIISFMNVSKLKFAISSFIGFSPAIILFSYFGSKIFKIYEIKEIKLNDIISKDFILFIIICILFLIFRIIYKTRSQFFKN